MAALREKSVCWSPLAGYGLRRLRQPALRASSAAALGQLTPSCAPCIQVCQARTIKDDFVSVRYVGKVGEIVVDDRYATTPLVFQLGAFYLPGFDEALTKQCVKSTLRLTWQRAPSINWGPVPPPAGPLVYDVTIDRDKMTEGSNNTKYFPPGQTILEFFELSI
ncbi:hypothetical protein T492DRAFT_881011 [Pavlovales sp. CCMP2436]|nr:hypothetical protein T492DRAFT_881011 [Pavlovales sp. CCMP2436]